MLAHFLASFVPDKSRWEKLSRFREAVFFEIGIAQLINGLVDAMAIEPAGCPRELFFYEAAVLMTYQATEGQEAFVRLYEMADNRADLAALRTRLILSDLPEGYFDTMQRRAASDAEGKNRPDQVRRDFARDAPAIAHGAHLNGLIWAARVYLGIFSDVDHAATSEARFLPILGDDLAAMALDGLVAALGRADVPSLQDVINLAVKRQHMVVWLVYIAGITELFRRTSGLDGVSDELLRAMLAFELTNPVVDGRQAMPARPDS